MKRAHIFISGFVQGVGFRHFTQRKAEELGLTGWVRNIEDDKVEAVFEGEQQKIQEMIKFCHKGPWMAKVDDVEILWEEASGELEEFEVR